MKIYDSVHGFIHFNSIESDLIDSQVFQRLHYIHQLGIAYLIYPGGTHTRFEHSLGTLHLATQIFDQIALDQHRSYWRQMLRLAALCHDLGHLPFSHTAEKQLLSATGHEEWTLKIIESDLLHSIWEQLAVIYPSFPIQETVAKLALGFEKLQTLRPELDFSMEEKIYSQIITGDFFGADRMDYLLRDAKATGLSYGLFDYAQLIEMLVLLPGSGARARAGEGEGKGEALTLGVEENGIESCEALLLARHFMQKRLYQHPAVKAYSFHLSRFMKIIYADKGYFDSIEKYLEMHEAQVLCALQDASKNPNHPGHLDACCLFDRKKRFTAIQLPAITDSKNLEIFKKEGDIGDTDIHWELAKSQPLYSKFPLPVLRKNKEIVSAEQFSEIAIPRDKKNWLFLAPEYHFSV